MAATTISRATITDDDGSGTTGTILNSAWVNSAIYDRIDALFTQQTFELESAHAGTSKTLTVANTSNTSSSSTLLVITVGGSNAGNPYIQYNVQNMTSWAHGIDNSDNDSWKLAPSATVSVNTALTVTVSRRVIIAGGYSAPTGVLEITGRPVTSLPAGSASENGRLEIDTTNNRLVYYAGGNRYYLVGGTF
jgi:hypothetical protein